jgi:hypothetical protein
MHVLILINMCTQPLSHEVKIAEDGSVSLSVAKLQQKTHNLVATYML